MNNNKNSLPIEVQKAISQERSSMQGELSRVWDLMGEAQADVHAGADREKAEMWLRLKERIAEDIKTPGVPHQTTLRRVELDRPAVKPGLQLIRTTRWVSLAASFAILMAAGLWFWNIPVTENGVPGQIVNVQLPDGSSVELNSGATLTYQRGFSGIPFVAAKQRNVTLKGEAYFKIHKSTVPFTVQTFNAEVSVLGTEFNVRSWSKTLNKTAVTLASGRVAVTANANPGKSLILSEPGHRIVVEGANPMPASVEEADINATLIWREAGFSVYNESLKSVFEELERRFNVEITVQNLSTLDDSLTIMLAKPGTIETILDDICTSKELSYRLTSRGYEIF